MNHVTKGLCVYGYNQEDINVIQHAISSFNDEPMQIISAIGMTDQTVDDIITNDDDHHFEDLMPHIVLFFGFDDTQISSILRYFPSEVPRPIFCCLTPTNQHWPFRKLMKHLIEEEKEMHTRTEQ